MDDDQRHALARHLNGMGMPQLVRRKTAAAHPPGDVVVTPHQPNWVQNGVWKGLSGYEFDPQDLGWKM